LGIDLIAVLFWSLIFEELASDEPREELAVELTIGLP